MEQKPLKPRNPPPPPAKKKKLRMLTTSPTPGSPEHTKIIREYGLKFAIFVNLLGFRSYIWGCLGVWECVIVSLFLNLGFEGVCALCHP